MKQKVLVIIGPTAVGKTKTSIEMAKLFNGEIISGDSMQIYQHLDIGTAKVTQEEKEDIVHHLIDCRHFSENYSVSDFQKEVRRLIGEITSRGKLPIICGGTGLYIRAALYDYRFDDQGHDINFQVKYESYTNDQLHAHLKSFDPKSANDIHPNNRHRVLRAIEIYETTGQTKSSQIEADLSEPLYDVYWVGLELEREKLYQRINQRVDVMFENGLLNEFQDILKMGATKDMQSMKAIGYKELFDYVEGVCTLDEAKDKICLNSRRYAKRQMTWFKHQMPVKWFEVILENFNQTLQNIKNEVEIWIKK